MLLDLYLKIHVCVTLYIKIIKIHDIRLQVPLSRNGKRMRQEKKSYEIDFVWQSLL